MELGDRKLKVLQAIIRDFIATAEPVGSRTIAKKYDLGISSATIRNEMADLEEMGLLEQPHTSAGRIPSDKGYRLYVDNLMNIKRLAETQEDSIRDTLLHKIGEMEQVISQTSKILSQMTKLTSVVLSPQFKQSKLKHVQLVPVDHTSILLVMVSESGMVKNTILRTNEAFTYETLEQISKMLNYQLHGLTIGNIGSMMIENVRNELRIFNSIIESVLPILTSALEEMEDVNLYLDGVANIFHLPEYNNIHKAREFMTLLEQKDFLTNLLLNSRDDVNIIIGRENKYEEMKECSLVTATYKINGKTIGKIGVIGPTRMDYEHIIAIVDFITKKLNNLSLDCAEE